MSVTSGFYNSLNGDRRYNAEQMSALFDTLINDGVFANIGTSFAVNAAGGLKVLVGIGRAWFNSTWLYNDTLLSIELDVPELLLDRYDAVVIEINHSEAVRAGSIKIIKGTPSSNPQLPAMVNDAEVHQYPLAYIYVKAATAEITQAEITNKIGTSDCPFITGILQVQHIDNIVAQWMSEWDQLVDVKEDEFNTWFESIKGALEGDIAANLTERVLALEDGYDDLATKENLEAYTFEKNTFTDQPSCQDFLDNYSNNFDNGTSYELWLNAAYSGDTILGGGQWKIIGDKTTERYETQLAIQYADNSFTIKGRSKFDGTWGLFSGLFNSKGGMIEDAINVPLILHNTSDTSRVMQKFSCNNVAFGYFGFTGVDNPVFRNGASTTDYALLHNGNYKTYVTPANIGAAASSHSHSGYAASSHNHSASNITSGTLPVARGGTGNTSVDTTPTSGSTKMVTSGGVYTALSGKAASSHNQAASTITAGTLAGKVNVNASAAATLGNAQVRDIYAGTSALTTGSTAITTGTIYVQYE